MRGEKEWEEMDTDLSQQKKEGTSEENLHSPKRLKKMNTEKIVKPQTEQTNIVTRRVANKTEFLRRHDIDILFVQEVMSTEVLQIRGYETYQNIGASIRGTVFLAKYGLHLENITALPSGRAIAAKNTSTPPDAT
jgi:hypothetical protein